MNTNKVTVVSRNLMEDVKAYLEKFSIESDILQHLSRDPSKEAQTIEMAKFLIHKGADVCIPQDILSPD